MDKLTDELSLNCCHCSLIHLVPRLVGEVCTGSSNTQSRVKDQGDETNLTWSLEETPFSAAGVYGHSLSHIDGVATNSELGSRPDSQPSHACGRVATGKTIDSHEDEDATLLSSSK